MASSKFIESHRENAEIYYGEDVCKQKALEMLEELSLPKGILPVEVVEFGRNRSTGFVWFKLKNKKEHKFKRINKVVSYDTEITCFVENGGFRKVTGIKSKEFFIWVTVSDIFIEDPSSGKIFISAPGGMKVHFPVSAFQPEEDKNMDDKKKSIITKLKT